MHAHEVPVLDPVVLGDRPGVQEPGDPRDRVPGGDAAQGEAFAGLDGLAGEDVFEDRGVFWNEEVVI